jgi:mannosyltransferase
MSDDGVRRAAVAAAPRPASGAGAWALAAIVAAMLLGLGLRLHGFTRHDVWLDEANSVAIAHHALADIPGVLGLDSSPPIYYWLLHLWMGLFGDGEAAVRLPSVLLGTLLIPITALLAFRLAGAWAAVAAAWLLAVSPFAVQFSQQARMYMLLPVFATLAAERLVVYIENGATGALIGHFLFLVLGFYTHNWGLFLLPASAAAVAMAPRARSSRWSIGAALAVVAYLPWIPYLMQQAHSDSYRFISVSKQVAWLLPIRTLILFSSGVGNPGEDARSLLPDIGAWVVLGVWIGLVGGALRRSRSFRGRAGRVLVVALVPLFIAAAWPLLGRPIYFLGRYEVMILPLLIAAVAGAATLLLPPRWLGPAVAVGCLGLGWLSFDYARVVRRTYPEPAMARALAPALRPGDRVVFTGLFRATGEYYLHRSGASQFAAASFPPDVAQHLGWYWDDNYNLSDPGLLDDARRLCPALGQRTWVLGSSDKTALLLLQLLASCAEVTRPFMALGHPVSSVFLAEPAPGRP